MAATIGALMVDIGASTARLERDLNKATKDVERWGKRTTSLARNIASAIGVGFSLSSVINATIEQERVTKQLETALRSTGGAAGYNKDQLTDMAASLQKVTTYGDEAIISAQSLLLTFTKVRGETFSRATEAILNVSTAMGQDLKSSALQVGKALNDPILGMTALSRSGIQFSEAQKKVVKDMVALGDVAGAQNIILKELEIQFGGSARAARDTFGGALTSLKNAFGDLLEARNGLPEATNQIERLTDLLQDQRTQEAADKLTGSLINGMAVVIDGSVAAIEFLEKLDEVSKRLDGSSAWDKFVRSSPALASIMAGLDLLNGSDLPNQPGDNNGNRFPMPERPPLFEGVKPEIEDIFEFSEQKLKEFASLGANITDPWMPEEAKKRMVERWEAVSRGIDLEIAKEQEAMDAKRQIWREGDDFWLMQHQDRWDVISRGLDAEIAMAEEANEKLKSSAQDLGYTFSSAFEDAIVEGKKLQDVLRGLAQDIMRIMVRRMITEPMGNAISGMFTANADGNVFQGGKVQRFASGAIFNKKTMFPMSNGIGMLGEAGPEAIMPLTRGADGKLGVKGGGNSQVVTVNNHIDLRGADESAVPKLRAAAKQISDMAVAKVRDELKRGGAAYALSR